MICKNYRHKGNILISFSHCDEGGESEFVVIFVMLCRRVGHADVPVTDIDYRKPNHYKKIILWLI